MKLDLPSLKELGQQLAQERKRQRLTREEAASVCGVSVSFIRDAELNPDSCSFGKLLRLVIGLGLSLEVQGLDEGKSKGTSIQEIVRAGLPKLDFGPSPSQILPREEK